MTTSNKEDKKENEDNSPSIGTLFIIATIVIILIVGLGIYNTIYNTMSHPYHVADQLRERLDDLDVSEQYMLGWNDCVEYYLWLETHPTNTTNGGS